MSKFIPKNGLQTENASFVSLDKTEEIVATLSNTGTLSFEGTAGELFSLTDSTSGVIFSINKPDGTPILEADADDTLRLAEFGTKVLVGYGTDNNTDIVQIFGSASATSFSGDIAYSGDLSANTLQDAIVELDTKVTALSDAATIAAFTWDSATTSPAASVSRTVPQAVLDNVYNQMKGCVLKDDGRVNYYLDASDWSLQESGANSDLTGTDGQVMVEIPAFYYRVTREGTEITWEISHLQKSGFALHPAFVKDGIEVSHRYYSAYDACVYSANTDTYISGLNLDNATALVDTGADILSSVKGIYPMVGLTRNEFRLLAANRGSGWRQLDFPLWSAVGMLYVVEYQTFYNQDVLGDGNTNNSYLTSSSNQSDSPHTIAGLRDDVGNGSTTPANGEGTATRPGTVAMKYRGIENQFGNCWKWVDAINVNVLATGNVYITNNNDRANYADDTATNHNLVTTQLTTGSANIRDFLPVDPYFLPESTSGTSAQYVTDRHYGSSTANRVVYVGGSAASGGFAGVFALDAFSSSGLRLRNLGGRLAY